VGALVSVLSLGDGIEQYARDQIEQTTDLQSISLTPRLFRIVDGHQFPREDPVSFSRGDADSVREVAGSAAFVTMLVTGQSLVTTSTDTAPVVASVVGTLAIDTVRLPAPLRHGRVFTETDVRADAPVAVISASLADRLRRGRAAAALVGDTLLFQGLPRVVIGVLAPAERRREMMALMPIGAAQAALPPALVGRPVSLVIQAARIEDVPALRAGAEAWLARRFGSNWKDRVRVGTSEARVAQARQGMLLFKLFMGALTGISLLVGGIGIMNVLLASVAERTREIGIRKATGARQGQILLQFLSESVAITSMGSVLGLALGVGAAFGAAAVMRQVTNAPVHAGISAGTAMIAVVSGVMVGILFGLYPALRAARLSPIEAIHRE
jgi:putative ABC transport system permease protein